MLVVAAALIDASGHVAMHQRPRGKHHGGLWEFPGGKVDLGESAEAALARELAEELGIAIDIADLAPVAFATGAPPPGEAGQLVILLYTCRRWRGEPVALEGEGLAWCKPDDCALLELAPLDRALLARLVASGGG